MIPCGTPRCKGLLPEAELLNDVNFDQSHKCDLNHLWK